MKRNGKLVELAETWRGSQKTFDSPNKNLRDEDLRKDVNYCLEKIPEKYREVVKLRHFGDLSYNEIADSLGILVGTVRSRLARGREFFRTYWEEIAA